VAEVLSVSPPATAVEISENLVTARFCSATSEPATMARFVLDLPGGKRGKFEVISLDPTDPDSSRVIQTNVVTFNGGVESAFPPVVLHASTLHRSTAFQLRAIGSGLTDAHELALAAPDGSWRLPLAVSDQTENVLDASASLAANLSASVLEVSGAGGGFSAAEVPPDPPPPALPMFDPPEGCETKMREVWPDHDPYLIQPEDFALVPGGWTPWGTWIYHVFYIRQNQYLDDANTTKNIGHAVSDSLAGWTVVDTAAIKVRPGRFDALHVWAPTIVRRGPIYNMFYTGVDASGNQRIGRATSYDLLTWTQGDSVLEVTSTSIPWADPSPDSVYDGATQLRDPFVMEDPNVPGEWLMYFVTVPAERTPDMVVGVARSDGDFSLWNRTFPFWSTFHRWRNDRSYVVESPHAFERDGAWWLFSTINGDTVWASANRASPSDTTTAHWIGPQKLWTLVPELQGPNLYYWHATEYLQISAINDIEFLAAYNDANVCISFTQMRPTYSPYLFSMGCPSVTGVNEEARRYAAPHLMLTGMRPARSRVGLRIGLPARMPVHLAIYDVQGRRVRTITRGELPAGETEIWWDGCDANGARARSGIYFVSLTAAGARSSVRVPLIR